MPKTRATGEVNLLVPDPYDVALISRLTGKQPIEVRLAMQKVGSDRRLILQELAAKN